MVGDVTLAPEGGSRTVDALAAHAAQPCPGGAATRDRRRRRDVEQRTQHEGALVHARMRYDQARLRKTAPSEKQQVEVEQSRRVAPLASLSPPAVPALDNPQVPQYRAG